MNALTGRPIPAAPTPDQVLTTSGVYHSLPHNRLLSALAPAVASQLASRLQMVDLAAGATLYQAGAEIRHVYFPITAVASLFTALRNGASAEVAVVGNEGVVGVCAFMGGGKAFSCASVQRAGRAWRMAAHDLADLARDMEPLRRLMLRYTQFLFSHMAQTAVCHRHHALAEKLCCWLLQHVERQADSEIRSTQECIAGLLGVRREGVTGALAQLHREGLVRRSRGVIRVLDRHGLALRSCECHAVVQAAYGQLCDEVRVWPRACGAPMIEAASLTSRPRATAPLTLLQSA